MIQLIFGLKLQVKLLSFQIFALKGLNMVYILIFFQGIAEMAGGQERSRYELLEISDPSTLLVRGAGTESYSI